MVRVASATLDMWSAFIRRYATVRVQVLSPGLEKAGLKSFRRYASILIGAENLMSKPRLSFWQIFNMSFGFLGIQFGWGLQLANMSGIYTYLGARPEDVPILWLAGPVTGLLVQPIVGSMSDRTWNRRDGAALISWLGQFSQALLCSSCRIRGRYGWRRVCFGSWMPA